MVIEFANRLLEIDPLRERAHQSLMQAYAALGKDDLAIRQFEKCREILDKELNVRPDDLTTSIYRDIRQKRHATSPEAKMAHRIAEVAIEPEPPRSGSSIAVMRFLNVSEDAEQEHLCQGLAESISIGLSRFPAILVIGLKSVTVAQGQESTPIELGQKMGLRHILRGRIQKAGQRIRISVEMVETGAGRIIWADKFDRDFTDIFDIEDEITAKVVVAVAGHIEMQEMQTAERYGKAEAYDLLLRGRVHLNKYTPNGEKLAREYFRKALEVDPEYSEIYGWLAISYIHEWEAGWSKDHLAALAKASDLASKALALNDRNSAILYAAGSVSYYQGDLDLACSHIDRALEINPNDYHNICAKGWYLCTSDDPSEGARCSLEAMRLNPLVPDTCIIAVGVAEYLQDNYIGALEAFSRSRTSDIYRLGWIAACYAKLGRLERAKTIWKQVEDLLNAGELFGGSSVEDWVAYVDRVLCFKLPKDREKFLEGVRLASSM